MFRHRVARASSVVEFRVLGPVNLLGADGRELRQLLAQPKRVALLAYLAAARPRRFHRRDSLLALFWPELDQEHARAALRQALHGLRRSVGEGAVESRGDEEIRLSDQYVWCDALAFDTAVDLAHHAEALELYRGDLLGGFFISGAPEFERWLEDERARLRRRAVETAWTLAESCRVTGDRSLASHWARYAAALVRDDEDALRRLIALLGNLGDKAGALQAYDVFARRLTEEYEAQPAAETRALISDIRSRENTIPSAMLRLPEPEDRLAPEAQRPPIDAGTPLRVADAIPEIDDLADGEATPNRRRRLWARAAVALASLTMGIALVWGAVSAARPHNDAAALDPTRVVVAEVSNRTGDTALNAVGELAREEITRGLALTDVVEIADPGARKPGGVGQATRTVPAGQEAAAARELAISTGSGLAVWGAVYSRGDQIEFAADIVDERDGKILRTLEPVRGDPLEPRPALMVLRDRIMTVVTEAVDPRLAASASVAGDPPLYDAYTEFITGVGIWYDGRNGRDALPHFKRAAIMDSTFALPLIWAAWVHQTFGQCDSTEAIAGRLAALHLSRLEHIQIDRQMARCRGDLPAAYRLAHVLVEARPRSEVWQEQLARDALNFDRPREAIEILERLHPERGALRGRASYYNWLTNARHLLGEHEQELEVARRGRARFPGNLAPWRTELVALSALGRGREVNGRLNEIDALSSDPIRRKATVMREISLDLAAHGDRDAASQALARTLAWHASQPDTEQATEYNRFERAQAYYAAGHEDSARAITEKLASAHPQNEQYAGLLGVLAAQRGDRATAAGIAERLVGLERPYERGQATYWRACIAAKLGRRDEAVELLRRALAEGYVFNSLFFFSAHVEPSFATLRGYAPFEALLRPKG
jgi:DNA-binding SARP family transcriptional activator/tetratricopeptide (TPR) repeat protein